MTTPDVSKATHLASYSAIEKLYNTMAYQRDADVVLSNGGVEGYICLAYYHSRSGATWYLLAREKSDQ